MWWIKVKRCSDFKSEHLLWLNDVPHCDFIPHYVIKCAIFYELLLSYMYKPLLVGGGQKSKPILNQIQADGSFHAFFCLDMQKSEPETCCLRQNIPIFIPTTFSLPPLSLSQVHFIKISQHIAGKEHK